jgi:mRNA interferase RelE/StbE
LVWQVRLDKDAEKQLRRLDPQDQRRLVKFLRERIASSASPRLLGEALKGALRTLWKYRVGDFRLICDLQDENFVVLVIKIGHRKDVYRR